MDIQKSDEEHEMLFQWFNSTNTMLKTNILRVSKIGTHFLLKTHK